MVTAHGVFSLGEQVANGNSHTLCRRDKILSRLLWKLRIVAPRWTWSGGDKPRKAPDRMKMGGLEELCAGEDRDGCLGNAGVQFRATLVAGRKQGVKGTSRVETTFQVLIPSKLRSRPFPGCCAPLLGMFALPLTFLGHLVRETFPGHPV